LAQECALCLPGNRWLLALQAIQPLALIMKELVGEVLIDAHLHIMVRNEYPIKGIKHNVVAIENES
jgi:hypothetical protein